MGLCRSGPMIGEPQLGEGVHIRIGRFYAHSGASTSLLFTVFMQQVAAVHWKPFNKSNVNSGNLVLDSANLHRQTKKQHKKHWAHLGVELPSATWEGILLDWVVSRQPTRPSCSATLRFWIPDPISRCTSPNTRWMFHNRSPQFVVSLSLVSRYLVATYLMCSREITTVNDNTNRWQHVTFEQQSLVKFALPPPNTADAISSARKWVPFAARPARKAGCTFDQWTIVVASSL